MGEGERERVRKGERERERREKKTLINTTQKWLSDLDVSCFLTLCILSHFWTVLSVPYLDSLYIYLNNVLKTFH